MHFQAITVLFCLFSQITDICQSLRDKEWQSYADDLKDVPKAGGIYAIGDKDGNFLYVGHSKNMKTRLRQHKSVQAIDEFEQQQFNAANGGGDLRIKWVKDPDHRCVEGEYLQCIEKKFGIRPPYNKKGGDKCNC